jgi:8-oxo-dGTP pyrophosphatase MutT (NUDIX family)
MINTSYNSDFIEKLKERYREGLPGRPFQAQMATYAKRLQLMDAPPTARLAAVLALLFPKEDEWHILLTERTSSNPNDRHKGQISFPGGQYDPEDADLKACALREAHEEVGIPPSVVNMIGPLTDLYIPVSNFHVHPYLGYMTHTPTYTQQTAEVKSIIETPLSILQQSGIRKLTTIKVSESIILNDVPYFDVFGNVVWGATAMMLGEFVELTKHIK